LKLKPENCGRGGQFADSCSCRLTRFSVAICAFDSEGLEG
jgi:hypothetical protein